MSSNSSRRRFLQQTFAGGVTFCLAADPAIARSYRANDKLNIGVIGVAGRGADNLGGVSSQNIVALCDIDDNRLAAAAKQFPDAKTYNDYRLLLDQKDIDAIVVSTPDHTHAVATAAAVKSGRHVYCEKPLAHSVWEARHVAELAKKHNRVTQMGTQIHATDNYRRVVELLQSGAIGTVSEIHVWADRVWAGDGHPADTPPVPSNIHWDLWIGPTNPIPYNPAYIPANWRGWWQFGNGTLGDMGCHHVDLSFWALNLKAPHKIRASGPPPSAEVTPQWMTAHYEFAAEGTQQAVELTWYQGGKRPDLFAEGKLPAWGDGSLFIGSKGMLLADYDRRVLLPEKDFTGFVPPSPSIPSSIGHHEEWIAACKTGGPTTCNFEYSGALSEAILLGCVAYRTGQEIEWDSARLKVRSSSDAQALIRPHFRSGWSL